LLADTVVAFSGRADFLGELIDGGAFPVFATTGVWITTSDIVDSGARPFWALECVESFTGYAGGNSNSVGEEESSRAEKGFLISFQVAEVEELTIPLVR